MHKSRSKNFFMGIGGGSVSGKSTIVNEIIEKVGPEKISVLHHDAYYMHRPELTFEERTNINFDPLDSLETELLVEHFAQLIFRKNVEIPIYNFARHFRESKSKKVVPCQILIIDGILVLNDDQLRKMMNLKVFVDVPPDLRFIRRLERDLCERGRSVESVTRQCLD